MSSSTAWNYKKLKNDLLRGKHYVPIVSSENCTLGRTAVLFFIIFCLREIIRYVKTDFSPYSMRMIHITKPPFIK